MASLAQRPGLDPRDRALSTELIYRSLRWGPGFLPRIDARLRKGVGRTRPEVVWALVVGAVQLSLLDRIPPHAAVATAVDAARAVAGEGAARLVNGVLRAMLREAGGERLAPPDPRACYPAFILDAFDDLGPAAVDAPAAYLADAPHCVRARGGTGDILEALAAAGVDGARPGRVPGSALLPRGGAAVRAGAGNARWLPQDEASLAVADAAATLARLAGEGAVVLDACCGGGVKSDVLHGALGSGARVVGMDLDRRRLDLARGLLATAPLVRTDCSVALPVAEGVVDVALVDAPCSGLGTMRRRPEIRARRKAIDVAKLARLQRAILASVARTIRPGGQLVYAVCTFTASEGPDVVRAFLEGSAGADFTPSALPPPPVPAWRLDDNAWLTWDDPATVTDPADTFFVAALTRRAGAEKKLP